MKKISELSKDIIFAFQEQKLLVLREIYLCNGNICGCNLIEKTGLTKDLLSYHIKSLRERGFLVDVKCGVRKNYSIAKERFSLVEEILKTARLI